MTAVRPERHALPEHSVPSVVTHGPRAGQLVHLLLVDEWTAAHTQAELRPASLAEQGFVHLSTPEQVALLANRLFAGRTDLLLLVLDPALLAGEVRWEPGVVGDPDAMRFPHLYGPLPITAVVAVCEYRPGTDGRFSAPTDLLE